MSDSLARAVAILMLSFLVLVGCAGSTPRHDPNPLDRWDPVEPMNRHIYRFNERMDRWILLPSTHAYDHLPKSLRESVRNFFTNFDEVTTIANSFLQASPKKTSVSTARLVINSTIGLLGFLDPASKFGLPSYEEDFGQTLGRWGLGHGPYLVLPLFGPSSLRDGTGLAGDRAAVWGLQTLALGDFSSVLSILVPIEVVSDRDWNDFRYGELGPFEYDLVRYMYLEYRTALVDD